MTPVIIGLIAFAALAVLVGLLANASRGRKRLEDIPPAMRPGYSDEQLERSVLERYMGWGIIFTAFFAIFLPLYWIREPARITSASQAAAVAEFERGEQLYVENCSLCHGQSGEGGGAASTYDPADSWPAPDLTTIEKRYEGTPPANVAAGGIRDYIEQTIHRGRPGTPMPAWGADYGGPLNDQQVTDITDWILLQQKAEAEEADPAFNATGEELYQNNCVRCHGEEIEGFIGPSLVGVFERHNRQTVLGILQNGIYLANGISMPPWQTGYMYPETRYTDAALNKIIDYLEEQQPVVVPEGAGQYRTPYRDGGPKGGGGGSDDEDSGSA
jgi:mono/diheme cytochrome c family protein